MAGGLGERRAVHVETGNSRFDLFRIGAAASGHCNGNQHNGDLVHHRRLDVGIRRELHELHLLQIRVGADGVAQLQALNDISGDHRSLVDNIGRVLGKCRGSLCSHSGSLMSRSGGGSRSRCGFHFSSCLGAGRSSSGAGRGLGCSGDATLIAQTGIVQVESIHLFRLHGIVRHHFDGRRKNVMEDVEVHGLLGAPKQLGTAVDQAIMLALHLLWHYLARRRNLEQHVVVSRRNRISRSTTFRRLAGSLGLLNILQM
mmetsp:Transcript_50950/g.88904  ORF Transcript_50950/g.88904 Transcript_50950/m.88904 type:complete len:257 (+) Transcript_50950:498-1268(+)